MRTISVAMNRSVKIMSNFLCRIHYDQFVYWYKTETEVKQGYWQSQCDRVQFLLPTKCTEWKMKTYNRPFFAVVAIFSAACGFPMKKEKKCLLFLSNYSITWCNRNTHKKTTFNWTMTAPKAEFGEPDAEGKIQSMERCSRRRCMWTKTVVYLFTQCAASRQ